MTQYLIFDYIDDDKIIKTVIFRFQGQSLDVRCL